MALEKQFLDCSTDQIMVAPPTTMSSYGALGFSDVKQFFTAYEEPGTRLVQTAQGVQEIATSTLYVMSSSASIAIDARITLPDGRVPKIIRVDKINDEQGQHHLEILV